MSGGVAQVYSILDSLPIAALLYDQDLYCLCSNAMAQAFLSADRPVCDSLHMHAPIFDRSTWAHYLHSAFARPINIQPVLIQVAGTGILARITCAPVREELGNPTRFGLLAIEELGSPSSRGNRDEGDALILQLAHRINGPLDGACRSISLAIRYVDKREDLLHYLRSGQQALTAARQCIRQVLDHAAKGLAPAMSIEGLVAQVIEAVRSRWTGGQIEISTRYAEGLPAIRFPGLFQVLCNLITNAFEAMPHGGNLTVEGMISPDAQLEITITDTGPGFDQRFLDKVFLPFFTTKLDGTGLGLAVSKDIVEQRGGSIRLDNQPGRGAKVTIRLPLSQIT
ncbi:MAG: ATP-binding protein [Sedimentisphaerales bacterium]|nr:ATP-binding protein [Sedimentisphaerales bacterium]